MSSSINYTHHVASVPTKMDKKTSSMSGKSNGNNFFTPQKQPSESHHCDYLEVKNLGSILSFNSPMLEVKNPIEPTEEMWDGSTTIESSQQAKQSQPTAKRQLFSAYDSSPSKMFGTVHADESESKRDASKFDGADISEFKVDPRTSPRKPEACRG